MALPIPQAHTDVREPWCDLIHRRCGLTFRTAQIPLIVDYVRQRAEAVGLSERAYFDRLAEAPDGDSDWLTIVEHLVNHETSFFRHPLSFEALRRNLLPELHTARGRSRINLLSAGCSTGQEAYSMAMVAMEHDPTGHFGVWGCDISRQAVEAARRGRFNTRAIAGVPERHRQRFLVSDGDSPEYEVCGALRRRVRFSAVNLFTIDAGITLSYDVIFCHNVLIYMSPAAVSQIVANLAGRLAPGGYLLLGPGEGAAERPALLEPTVVSGVRMFRRRAHAQLEGRS